MTNLEETIAKLINHGLSDSEIATALTSEESLISCPPAIIGIIRNLMTAKNEDPIPLQLHYSKKQLDNNEGGGGLEIKIEGCIGDPEEDIPGTAVFIEYYKDDVRVLVWEGTNQNPHTHILKQI